MSHLRTLVIRSCKHYIGCMSEIETTVLEQLQNSKKVYYFWDSLPDEVKDVYEKSDSVVGYVTYSLEYDFFVVEVTEAGYFSLLIDNYEYIGDSLYAVEKYIAQDYNKVFEGI